MDYLPSTAYMKALWRTIMFLFRGFEKLLFRQIGEHVYVDMTECVSAKFVVFLICYPQYAGYSVAAISTYNSTYCFFFTFDWCFGVAVVSKIQHYKYFFMLKKILFMAATMVNEQI